MTLFYWKYLKTFSVMQLVLIVVFFIQLNWVCLFAGADEFENSWFTYFEPPCCNGDDGGRHFRHHRDNVREFNCGRLYYRTFYLDNKRNFLYVGAMDRIFRLNLSNINQSHCEKDSLILEASNRSMCMIKGLSEDFDCRNHIRAIHPIGNGDKLYVCGTNAHNPKDSIIFNNLTHLPRHEYIPGIGDGRARCPLDPNSNSTSVWVTKGNPGNIPALYSGVNGELYLSGDIIFRMPLYNVSDGKVMYEYLRTLRYDSKLLNQAHFVGSYDVGEYVFFFFRENAIEYSNCGKIVYSRVARVCKSDLGGSLHYSTNNWATFLKARLNCSIDGEFPFYFNEIQHVYKFPDDDNTFYAVFTTSSNGLIGSAICTFKLSNIQDAFNGKFNSQATSSSSWLPVSNKNVPEPRPGTCIENTKALPTSSLNFIRSHSLMYQSVNNEHSNPIYYKKDVVFVRIVVDQLKVDSSNIYYVYYAGTSDGKIYKIVQWFTKNSTSSALLDVLEITDDEPIRAIELSQENKYLYVSSDSTIKQINLIMCARRYDSCIRCVRDPYCGWDPESNTCQRYYTGLLQDVTNKSSGICDKSVIKKKITVTWGQSVHLTCFKKVPVTLSSRKIQWYHSKDKSYRQISFANSHEKKYIETKESGLVILSLNEADSGRYDCMVDNSYLCSYDLNIDLNRCTAPSKSVDYQRIYSNWCHEFEKYKMSKKVWEKKQLRCMSKKNSTEQNNLPNEILHSAI